MVRRHNRSHDFGYDYFDNPNALGYRGYYQSSADQPAESWSEIAAFCGKHGFKSAIDVGCAKGYLVRALLEAGIAAIGYDLSDYALLSARDLPCKKHDIRDGIPDRADVIFCLGVLLYVEEADVSGIITNLYESAERCLCFSSYYVGDHQDIADPLRTISRPKAWWRASIERNGFAFSSSETYFDVYTK
jgi:SAM-dependent methyltransferase